MTLKMAWKGLIIALNFGVTTGKVYENDGNQGKSFNLGLAGFV